MKSQKRAAQKIAEQLQHVIHHHAGDPTRLNVELSTLKQRIADASPNEMSEDERRMLLVQIERAY